MGHYELMSEMALGRRRGGREGWGRRRKREGGREEESKRRRKRGHLHVVDGKAGSIQERGDTKRGWEGMPNKRGAERRG